MLIRAVPRVEVRHRVLLSQHMAEGEIAQFVLENARGHAREKGLENLTKVTVAGVRTKLVVRMLLTMRLASAGRG